MYKYHANDPWLLQGEINLQQKPHSKNVRLPKNYLPHKSQVVVILKFLFMIDLQSKPYLSGHPGGTGKWPRHRGSSEIGIMRGINVTLFCFAKCKNNLFVPH